jgi:DNA-binding transcriptional ArsR family regulator
MTPHTPDPSYDERFKLLSNGRRRYVLYLLYRAGGPVDVDELSRAVATVESDAGESTPADEACRRVQASLVGTHMPRLAAAGLIEYDGRSAALTAETRRSGVLGTDRERRSWHGYYATFGLLAWALIVGAAVGVDPIASLSWDAIAGTALLVALALALVHYVVDRRSHAPLATFEALVE